MLTHMLDRFAIGAFTPLEAWLLLLLLSIALTVFFCRLLRQAQENSAILHDPVGTFTMRLGGPVAFYAVLLLLGRDYIEKTLETPRDVKLSGVMLGADDRYKECQPCLR